MVLQELIWNRTGEYGSSAMFFRGEGAWVNEEMQMVISQGSHVSFDTYFNMLSVCKWQAYTIVQRVSASVVLCGKGCISLIGLDKGDVAKEHLLCEAEYDCPVFKEVEVFRDKALAELHDFCYLRIDAEKETIVRSGGYHMGEECHMEAGFFDIREDDGRKGHGREGISIACCICTYQRIEYVRRNVEILLREIVDNSSSPMAGKMDIYVVDNGGTLSKDMFQGHPRVHIFANKNYGGSGGFTRGMIEALFRERKGAFTHLLLMDDDILIYPKVLERTYILLRLLKESCRDHILGGAMLLLENRDIQAESCGYYDILTGCNRHSVREMMNLGRRENLIANECEEGANFSGWWYSCIPAVLIGESNLPLPLFLHRDDQEFGVRSGKEVLQMGGICIWHPSPAGKHSEYIFYYDMRNMLIASQNHYPERLTGRMLRRLLLTKVIQCCLGYRYGSAMMCLRGCEDFCKGISAFKKMNPEELHSRLRKETGYEWFAVSSEMYAHCLKKAKDEEHLGMGTKLRRYCFPSSEVCYAESDCNYPSYLGYRQVVYLNENKDKGYRLTRSFRETFRVMGKLLRVWALVIRKYHRACAEWEKGMDELKSLKFWEEYLAPPPEKK